MGSHSKLEFEGPERSTSILIESPADPRDDIVALVFESVRLCTPEQIKGVNVFVPPVEAPKNIAHLTLQADHRPGAESF
jgi:hypothetical protein